MHAIVCLMQMLLTQGADVNQNDNDCMSPLLACIEANGCKVEALEIARVGFS